MEYVWYFLQIVLYSLGAIVICGLAVRGCEYLFCRLLGSGAGYRMVIGTSIIGTPVHEMGHALMCIIFGHRITKVVLWQKRSASGTLGFVSHTYNPKNIYQQLGNIFIGVGPIFSGLAVLTLVLHLCFPGTLNAYYNSASAMVANGADPWTLFLSGLHMIPNMAAEFNGQAVPLWAQILGVIVIVSVSLHINLSPADIKGALSAIPLYLVLVLIVTVVTSLMGSAAMWTVLSALRLYSAYLTALFVIVLVFAVTLVAVALIIWLIRKIFFGK